MGFMDALQERVLLADGGMGTQIYAKGIFINRCFDELNLTQAKLVGEIHAEYLKAGADIIETNTFGANRFKFLPHGLENRVREVNRLGVEIAKKEAREKAFVAASIGPTGVQVEPLGRVPKEEVLAAFKEQVEGLLEGEPDLFILETFYDLEEMKLAYQAVRSLSNLPLICQASFRMIGTNDFTGLTPEHAVKEMTSWGATIIGTNCSMGPQGILRCIERMHDATNLVLSAMPNAGQPSTVGGRTLYMATPEYMAEYARRIVQAGARIIGGCCGTTPGMIKEMRNFLKSVQPARKTIISFEGPKEKEVKLLEPTPTHLKTPFGAILGKKFGISVELDPPRGLDPSKMIEGARFLKSHGIDAINIADGPRAIARMSPMALAMMIKQQVGIETIVHYCCRDRNLLGMQMDLIGANALGLRNILIITGDPPKMGNYPDATAVFDVDSIGLLRFASRLNRGSDMAGESLNGKTDLLLGTGCNPGAKDIDVEVARYARKIEAGAEYVFSQPVYDPELLHRFLEKIKGLPPIPFFVGILPLASLSNAEFLHSEVPGMQVPDDTMARLRRAQSKEDQRREGIRIAQESLKAASQMPQIKGAYIFPPFNRVEAVLEVMDVL